MSKRGRSDAESYRLYQRYAAAYEAWLLDQSNDELREAWHRAWCDLHGKPYTQGGWNKHG